MHCVVLIKFLITPHEIFQYRVLVACIPTKHQKIYVFRNGVDPLMIELLWLTDSASSPDTSRFLKITVAKCWKQHLQKARYNDVCKRAIFTHFLWIVHGKASFKDGVLWRHAIKAVVLCCNVQNWPKWYYWREVQVIYCLQVICHGVIW